MKPKRIQRRRTKGWRKPEGAVCVTRPGFWGNPYPTAAEFREMLIKAKNKSFWPLSEHEFHMVGIAANLDELRGKDLCCWCPLDAECHADVLIEFANHEWLPPAEYSGIQAVLCKHCGKIDYEWLARNQ